MGTWKIEIPLPPECVLPSLAVSGIRNEGLRVEPIYFLLLSKSSITTASFRLSTNNLITPPNGNELL